MTETLSRRAGPGSPYERIPIKLLSLVPVAVFVAWLATACYALAYLVSH
jgi:hypothetical protein